MALTTRDCSGTGPHASQCWVAYSVPSVMVLPSAPGVLAAQVTVGVSGFTVTASVLFAALALPSALSALSLPDALPISSLVGVTRRLDKVQPPTLTEVLPALAVKLCPLPSLRVAPTGMALTTSD